jgi:hypothetical protein
VLAGRIGLEDREQTQKSDHRGPVIGLQFQVDVEAGAVALRCGELPEKLRDRYPFSFVQRGDRATCAVLQRRGIGRNSFQERLTGISVPLSGPFAISLLRSRQWRPAMKAEAG